MGQDKKTRKMLALHSNTIRGIAEEANRLDIQKEDIVQVLPVSDGFVLLYYK